MALAVSQRTTAIAHTQPEVMAPAASQRTTATLHTQQIVTEAVGFVREQEVAFFATNARVLSHTLVMAFVPPPHAAPPSPPCLIYKAPKGTRVLTPIQY